MYIARPFLTECSFSFGQVFSIGKQAGLVPEDVSLEHVPFGLVQGEDGKKFKVTAVRSVICVSPVPTGWVSRSHGDTARGDGRHTALDL